LAPEEATPARSSQTDQDAEPPQSATGDTAEAKADTDEASEPRS